jgi:hypothetical protein
MPNTWLIIKLLFRFILKDKSRNSTKLPNIITYKLLCTNAEKIVGI